MSKIIAIDYGAKRCGIAESDDLRLIATGLTTVDTRELLPFLKNYFAVNNIHCIVIGKPVRLHGELSAIEEKITSFIKQLRIEFPNVNIERENEWFTSKMAVKAMVDGGMKKKNRRVKANIDRVSATIILQSFMERNRGF